MVGNENGVAGQPQKPSTPVSFFVIGYYRHCGVGGHPFLQP